ncbi:MAG: hypothetical protein ACRD1R_02510 [Acidobacteriota bacterium]
MEIQLAIGTLSEGTSTAISFRVAIENSLPAGVSSISTQGQISGSNFAEVATDDPETPATEDPTVTLLVGGAAANLSSIELLSLSYQQVTARRRRGNPLQLQLTWSFQPRWALPTICWQTPLWG